MKSVRDWMEVMEKAGELKRISKEVDYHLELGHVATMSEQKLGPALLFEKVKDHDMPVLISTITTTRRLAITLGQPAETSFCEIAKVWKDITVQEKKIKPVEVKGDIPVMEVVKEGKDVNLYEFPSPQLYPQDGGRYLGLAFNWITKDPDTGWTNVGVYRGQLHDEKTIGANAFQKSKHAKMHFDKYIKASKSRIPAACYCGCDMSHFVVASNMVPEGVDEYDVIGALMGQPVEIFRSDFTGLPLPAHAEIILEGEIELDPDKWKQEGPLGEFVGYYGASTGGGRKPKPWFEVQRILRRKNPIFVATTVGRPVGDTHITTAIGRTALIWSDLENAKVPGIKSVYVLPEASGRMVVVVSTDSKFPAHAYRVAAAVHGGATGHFGSKVIIVVDGDIPADDLAGVWWSLGCRYNPITDTQMYHKIRQTPFDPALPIDAKDFGSGIVIDATTPAEWGDKAPLKVELDPATEKKCASKWKEYGFDESY